MANITKTLTLTALIALYAVNSVVASSVYAKQDITPTNSYNKNPVKSNSIVKQEDISNKIEDNFYINTPRGTILCERVTEFLDYFTVRGKEGLYNGIIFEFLYKGIIFESNKKPMYPSAVNNIIKEDKINELVGSFKYNKEDIAIWFLSLKELGPNKYFALFKTKKPAPKKELKIEIIETEKK